MILSVSTLYQSAFDWGREDHTIKRKKKWIDHTVTLMFVILFLYSAFDIMTYYLDQTQNEEAIKEAQVLYRNHTSAEAAVNDQMLKFAPLLEVNPDIVGWIRIDETNIDYPILQADDNEFYLRRNYKYENNIAGSIFMDFRNVLDGKQDQNLIVYGHRMRNGTMFADLDKFTDREFFYGKREFLFETLHAQYEVEIFSVYQTTTDFNYIRTDFSNNEDYVDFLKSLKQRSMYPSSVNLTEDTVILTLSTCDYELDADRGRLVVHGVIKEK